MIHYTAQAKFLLFVILFLGTAVEIFAAAGDLDLTFWDDGILAADHGFDSESIVDLAVQPDGKIIVIGWSHNSSSSARRILFARYNPNGSIDTTFGTSGKVSIQSRNPGELALQPDGKIVFVSPSGASSPFANFYVGRLNSNGSFDATFNGTGIVDLNLRGTDDYAHSVKIQADGKIVVGGTSSTSLSGSQKDYALVRFNADGSLDTTFDGDGKVFTTAAPQAQLIEFSELVIQPDGKIAVVGVLLTYMGGNLDFEDFLIVRYNSNGSLDTTFDGDGIVTTRFTPQPPATRAWASARKLLVQSDGKIVVVGNAFIRGPSEFAMAAAARYNTDGSLDSSYANGGKAMISYPPFTDALVTDAALQADNKIVIGGYSYGSSAGTHATVARLNTDGSLDSGFSGDGVSAIISPPQKSAGAFGVAIQPNGKILIGGSISWSNTGSDFMLARFEASTCTMNCVVPRREVIADFDGDGKTDLSVLRPSNGAWYINPSSANNPNSAYGVQFIAQPDYLTPADFDGDGKTDIAIWHTFFNSTRYFNILRSATNTVRLIQFGQTGDDPRVVGDWDGDGRADLAVYRQGASAGAQSFFFYLPSTQPTIGFATVYWGTAGDEPVRGDFDGDGRTDAAVFRASDGVWYVLQSSNNQLRYERWGLASDKRVAADYDGDGKTDFAIYRDGLWAVLQSSNNQQRYASWGLPGDRLVAGDYDGDGKTDFAVWRGAGVYYILQSSNSQQVYQYLGIFSDIPVASAFVQ